MEIENMKIKKLVLPIMCILMLSMIAISASATVVNTSIGGTFSQGNGTFSVSAMHGNHIVIITFDSDDAYIPRTLKTGDHVVVTYTNTLTETTDADGNTIFVWVKSNVCVTEITKTDSANCNPKTAARL